MDPVLYPGTPGEDYPIFSAVPSTSFLCKGQVDGGYYADPEAECQVGTSLLGRPLNFLPMRGSGGWRALC
jgi:hypothetical protein